jgi:HEAT repeat protein
VDSRRWTVEGLAVVGTTPTIELLLKTLHDDPSPLVRESAACGLAASGMFTPEQRLSAVPQLVDYAGDPSLDNQTRSLVFRALSEITGQRLPNDPAVWRSWYEGISSQESGARGR